MEEFGLLFLTVNVLLIMFVAIASTASTYRSLIVVCQSRGKLCESSNSSFIINKERFKYREGQRHMSQSHGAETCRRIRGMMGQLGWRRQVTHSKRMQLAEKKLRWTRDALSTASRRRIGHVTLALVAVTSEDRGGRKRLAGEAEVAVFKPRQAARPIQYLFRFPIPLRQPSSRTIYF